MADLTGMMQAAAGAAGGGDNLFIEDVFSCFLYTGNGSTQTITNGIDLDGEGGLVWLKPRSNTGPHNLYDSAIGISSYLKSNSSAASETFQAAMSSLNSNGFSLKAGNEGGNENNFTYVSWTFRKALKFFDVVTYTGTGANRTVAHNLGSVPGCYIVKRYSTNEDWFVYHRITGDSAYLKLNDTDGSKAQFNPWNNTTPTDTVFSLGNRAEVNGSGQEYIAYLFAHDDGGFGDDGTENVITCGGYTGNGSATGPTITLGYEPQWLLIKRAGSDGEPWIIIDNMRGMDVNTSGTGDALLNPNNTNSEGATKRLSPTATGFVITDNSGEVNTNGVTYIFIAIRRGPMKTPTAGTEVFSPNLAAVQGQLTTGFPVDLGMWNYRTGYSENTVVNDRLRGVSSTNSVTNANNLITSSNVVEQASQGTQNWNNTGLYAVSGSAVFYSFRRAPGYFDVVAYTGTGSYPFTINHNLGVVPELMIFKKRDTADSWYAYAEPVVSPNANWYQNFGSLNQNSAFGSDTGSFTSSPTSTTIPTASYFADSAVSYIVYLFASLAGVSDIGTYTGNGTSLTVTTGFQPRFIMVKRTNSGGAARNWIVGDSARGLVAGDDPALFFNSSEAETTGQDWVDVSATGFTVNETALNANVSTGVYLYWVIS